MTTQFIRTIRGGYINPRFILGMNRIAYSTDADPDRQHWEVHLSNKVTTVVSREVVQELVGKAWQEPPESADD